MKKVMFAILSGLFLGPVACGDRGDTRIRDREEVREDDELLQEGRGGLIEGEEDVSPGQRTYEQPED